MQLKLASKLMAVVLLAFTAVPALLSGQPITEFDVGMTGPLGITAGPDGNIWFAESYTRAIARLTPDGFLTEFPLSPSFDFPEDIVRGPDGLSGLPNPPAASVPLGESRRAES